jgi:tetratricopeptide (TPR) repeat protein
MSKLGLLLTVIGFAITAAHSANAQTTAQRFDYLVREDMFRGFAGDQAAFDRAMALCEARLAENPDHPEALVWHGTGLLLRSGEAFRSGDTEKATLLNRSGVAEMARAVALAPNNLSVRIPRGAVLLAAGMRIADAQRARPYFETAVEDFELALAVQAPRLATLAQHPKGELFAALAEGWSRLGDAEKSRRYLDRIVAELPDTIYARAAGARIADPGTNARITCLGCHPK